MAKKDKNALATSAIISPKPHSQVVSAWYNFFLERGWMLIAAISFLLYINTVTNDYAIDDVAFITENKFVKQGLAGIPDILTHDSFYGFYGERANIILTGGRYRPMTLMMYAIEYQIFGSTPWIGHLINVLLFTLSMILLYFLLLKIFGAIYEVGKSQVLAGLTTLVFAVHPVHTEVVANIKGRDEIMVLLCLCTALFFAIQYLEKQTLKSLILSCVFLFIGLLSKENSIVFLAIFPTILFVVYKKSLSETFLNSLPYIGLALVFLAIRYAVLQKGITTINNYEILNNPFVKYENGRYLEYTSAEKYANIFYCLGYYIKLLFVPYPLTHDYYPRFVAIVNWSNPSVWIGFLINCVLLISTIYAFFKRNVYALAGVIYFSSLVLVSNIIFPIGTNMGERFIYIASLGFCIAIVLLSYWLVEKYSLQKIALAILCVVTMLFGYKTFTRNLIWKNDFTLYKTDFEVSKNSLKLNNAYAGELVKRAQETKDSKARENLLLKAKPMLQKVIKEHPSLKLPYLTMGSALFMENKFDSALVYYNTALKLDPNFTLVKNNLPIVYKGAGRYAGEVEHNVDKALELLEKSYELDSTDAEVWRLLGTAHGFKGNKQLALDFFLKFLEKYPNDKQALQNVSIAYAQLGDAANAKLYADKFQAIPE